MNQTWFERPDERRRKLAGAVWVPLRAMNSIEEVGQLGHLGYRSGFYDVGTLAIPTKKKPIAEKLGWMDVGISHNHSGQVQQKEYIPCDLYQDYGGTFSGLHLVLDQRGNSSEQPQWESMALVSPTGHTELAHRRGGFLDWYRQDTGAVGCSPSYDVHFGLNPIGLVNVYAEDIGHLPEWQQQIWAGHNVGPEGKVAEELLASQMKAEPADTLAPETFLGVGLATLEQLFNEKLAVRVLRQHDEIPHLLSRAHRFRATDKEGLFSLAKDLARLTADRLDSGAIQRFVKPPAGVKWGSLKSLENLLATQVNPDIARIIMGPLVGIYELRHADAHLPSAEVEKALRLAKVEQSSPYVFQGHQLLHACVDSIHYIIEVLRKWPASGAGMI